MGNKKTPLLQKLRNVGGTLYVFPSASEDIGLNLQSTTTGVAMSHFALLNIPNLTINNCLKECSHTITADNGNEALAMSLQNYAMNFETHLTNRQEYNYQKLETVSEKVFWKWARHIGIIDTSVYEDSSTKGLSKVTDNIYIENAYNGDSDVTRQDNTVIKCFGSIDAGNQLSTEFGMFNETYINIPTSWGSGPVFMKHSDSENFKLGNSYTVDNIDHLEGRGDSNEYYSYFQGQDYPFFDSSSNGTGGFDTYVINNEYDGFEILKDLNQIQTASRKQFNNDEILFDSYDDINIDTLNQLNVDQQFEFNTILLYYSVYDQDDLVKTAYTTNLFGVIFLDGARPSGDTFYIPTITKRKSTTTQFGNSYSFRVNLKTMSVYDNTDAIIQDNTTISGVNAVEFSDAISNMNHAIDIMNSNLATTLAIQDQYAAIINYYDNFEDDLRDISTCLYAYLKGTRSSFIDTSVLYANEIRTSKAESSFENNKIIIRAHDTTLDENGDVIYKEPVVTIADDDVIIPVIHNTSMWTTDQYVVNNMTNAKGIDIDASLNESNVFVYDCKRTIDKAFGENGLGVSLKIKDNQDHTGSHSYNELYINPDSSIFNVNDQYNLRYMLDENNNVNYLAIIPYLVAEVKHLRSILISAGLEQDLTDLTDDDFYNDIFRPQN